MTPRRTAVVRRPGPLLADGLTLESPTEPIDMVRAQSQWNTYLDAMESTGWTIVECPPADDCPDAVFIEDTVVVCGNRAIVCRPGAESRRPETTAIRPVFESLGLEVIDLPDGCGTIDGGDVLKIGSDVIVGVSDRTDQTAIDALAEVLGSSWRVTAVPISGTLHLKSAITALPDGQVIGIADQVDTSALGRTVWSMPEIHGSHVVHLDDDTLLVAASAPESAAKLRGEGYDVVTVDISEFEKLDGCVTCLSVRIR